jgi:hypothetical protein
MRSLAAALAFLAVGCRHHDPARPPAVVARRAPQSESECRACNGEWGPHGLRQNESCLCHTHDAGKVCKDGGDCEGECVGDGTTEVTDPGPPPRGYFLGRCSEYDHLFGCHKLLTDGTKAAGPTRLDQPAPELCVD